MFLLLCLCCFPATSYACHPTLLCVDDLGSSNYKAHFGFVGSENPIPLGSRNNFSGVPAIAQDQGQGTNFSASSVAISIMALFFGFYSTKLIIS
jgi:hypothetical protein